MVVVYESMSFTDYFNKNAEKFCRCTIKFLAIKSQFEEWSRFASEIRDSTLAEKIKFEKYYVYIHNKVNGVVINHLVIFSEPTLCLLQRNF